MLHKETLKLLIPLALDGKLAADLVIEGAALDAVQARFADFHAEISPDSADELLARWEAIYELMPVAGASQESRQAVLLGKFRAFGDIKKPYFVALAASMGYAIRIEDCIPAMSDWLGAGDELLEDLWVYFTAGVGLAGDTLAFEDVLLPWVWEVVVTVVPASPPSPDLEQVLQDLKPHHILLNFTYL